MQFKRTQYFQTFDEKLFKWKANVDLKNGTYDGPIIAEVFEEIPELIFQVRINTEYRSLMNTTVNLCNWYKKRRANFLIHVFTGFVEKYYNPMLFQCPIKKGRFEAAPAKPIPNLNILMPGFAPPKNEEVYNMTYVFKAKDGRKITFLGIITEIYSFT